MANQYDFGMIGLGVMGSNLLLNMADHGFGVMGYDKNPAKTVAFEASATPGTVVKGVNTLQEMVSSLRKPRKLMMLVPAGSIVDSVISELIPLLEKDDIVIDGGNSHFTDTLQRIVALRENNFHFMGIGISGGEMGARTGPSIMPGGDEKAYAEVKPILEAVAAKVDGRPCVAYLGKDAAGHFVKMVHNGIEYAIMQLISECYDLLHNGLGLSNDELHKVFAGWNSGPMRSFLLEITAQVFLVNNDKGEGRLLDSILDKAGAKGTGKWTSQAALDLGVPIPTIDMAVMVRNLSSLKDQRATASKSFNSSIKKITAGKDEFIGQLHDALLFATVASYAQGLALLQKASSDLAMQIPISEVVRVWSGGCIIRSGLLPLFSGVYQRNSDQPNLILDEEIVKLMGDLYPAILNITQQAIGNDYPVNGFASALNYFNTYRRDILPVNMIQAQRDLFGAHTYERIDMPGAFHNEWNG